MSYESRHTRITERVVKEKTIIEPSILLAGSRGDSLPVHQEKPAQTGGSYGSLDVKEEGARFADYLYEYSSGTWLDGFVNKLIELQPSALRQYINRGRGGW